MILNTLQIFGKEYLSPRTVAEMLKLTVSSVHNMIRRGELSAVRMGGRVLITKESLQACAINSGLMTNIQNQTRVPEDAPCL